MPIAVIEIPNGSQRKLTEIIKKAVVSRTEESLDGGSSRHGTARHAS